MTKNHGIALINGREMVLVAVMRRVVRCLRRCHGHPAHQIFRGRFAAIRCCSATGFGLARLRSCVSQQFSFTAIFVAHDCCHAQRQGATKSQPARRAIGPRGVVKPMWQADQFASNDSTCLWVHDIDKSPRVRGPLLAQLDRASGFEPEGRGFESLGAGQVRTSRGDAGSGARNRPFR